MPQEQIPWEGQVSDEAQRFASQCAQLRSTNPYGNPPLAAIMVDVVSELWDQRFSQSEIRAAFEHALVQLRDYAAGEERRDG